MQNRTPLLFVVSLVLFVALAGAQLLPSRAQERPQIDSDISGPRQGVAGQPLTFTASIKERPTNPTDVVFAWEYGDGNVGIGAMVTHVYSAAGMDKLTAAPANAAEMPEGAVVLHDGAGAGSYGWVQARSDADGTLHVTVTLHGVRTSAYGVSVCRVSLDENVVCVPPGTALGVRVCQTQSPNTGFTYCRGTDENGSFPAGAEEFVYPGLDLTPNLVLVWNANDGTDHYLAAIGPGVPATLAFPNAMPPADPD